MEVSKVSTIAKMMLEWERKKMPPRPMKSPIGHRYSTKLYYYPVEYGSPHHPSFAFTLCSELSTVPSAHIINWYLCAFNLYVSPVSVALQNYEPTRDLNPVKVTTKDLPFSDSAVSDYETFVSKSKTDPSYHGWFNQSDFTIESVEELFTSKIDADDRQTIETVNIYYLCLLTLAMFKDLKYLNYSDSDWIEKPANELKALLRKHSYCKIFPTTGTSFAKRLIHCVWRLERLSEFRATLMKLFIDLVFACRDGHTTSTFFTPFNHVIKRLESNKISFVQWIKTYVIDVSHPIRHASFIKEEASLFDQLLKDLDTLGRHRPYARILNKMTDGCCQASFPNLVTASIILMPRDKRPRKDLKHTHKISHLLLPLIEAYWRSNDKLEQVTADQVLEMETDVIIMEARDKAMAAENTAMEADMRAMEDEALVVDAENLVLEAEALVAEAKRRVMKAEARTTKAEARIMKAEARAKKTKGR